MHAKEREVEQRVRLFRGARPAPVLHDRTVIVVDDGIATGGTAQAALRSIRAGQPRSVVLAVPVAAPDALEELAGEVEDTICLLEPDRLQAIGAWYEDFTQVSDQEVLRLLERARREHDEVREHCAPQLLRHQVLVRKPCVARTRTGGDGT